MDVKFSTSLERTPLKLASAATHSIQLDLLRMDLLDRELSGNKWFKLKYHLQAGFDLGLKQFVSFGGGYSNHLHALAAAGRRMGFSTAAFIRGDYREDLSPTLRDCIDWGMELNWLSYSDYRMRGSEKLQKIIQQHYPRAWIIPAGGGGCQGVKGIRECISDNLERWAKIDKCPYDILVCPVGSGTTFAGMIAATESGQHCIGISALKNAHSLQTEVHQLLPLERSPSSSSWQLIHDYHFGGFARMTDQLADFVVECRRQTGVLFDPVYTAKTLYGIQDLIVNGKIPDGTRILMLHTGGLQGWRGYPGRLSE